MIPAAPLPRPGWGGTLALALCSALAAYGAGYRAGLASGTADMERLRQSVATREAAQQQRLLDAERRNQDQETAHAQRVAALHAAYATRAAEARQRDARVLAELRAGQQRLRLPATHPVSAPLAADAATAGIDDAGDGELAPATAAALYTIAADGDRAIDKLNALQDWARSALLRCGAPGA